MYAFLVRLRRFLPGIALAFCALSLLFAVFGPYSIAIGLSIANLLVMTLDIPALTAVIRNKGGGNILDIATLEIRKYQLFAPINDLVRLPLRETFPAFIWITYMFHIFHSLVWRQEALFIMLG
jgi:hypothetical protein